MRITILQKLSHRSENSKPQLGGLALGGRAPGAFSIESLWKQGLPKDLSQTYLQVLEGLLGKHGASVACMGAGHCKQRSQGIVTSMCSPGVSHFGNTWAHPSGLRSPRPNNKWGGNTAQPISTVCLQFSQAHTAASSHAETNPTHQWAGPSPSHQEFCSTPPSQLHPQGGRHQKQERLQPCTL